MSEDAEISTDCFISYVRRDNDDFAGIVDEIKKSLSSMYEAETGRALRIFLDRESIGWGAEWREAIRSAIENATLFIPVVSMRYFASAACVDELLSYYSNAQQLGVPELILPLVFKGASRITKEDSRAEVRLIEERNYVNIDEAWNVGYGSPEWRRAMSDIAGKLITVLEAAESELTSREEVDPGLSGSKGVEARDLSAESSADAMQMLEEFQGLAASVQELPQALQSFSEASASALGPDKFLDVTPEQGKMVLLQAAKELRNPSRKIGDQGRDLLSRATACDAQLRSVVEELMAIGSEESTGQAASLVSTFKMPPDLAVSMNQLGELISMLKSAAVLNVSLRGALKPAIQGLQDIQTAVRMIGSWERLAKA